jgi:hypothetical protein
MAKANGFAFGFTTELLVLRWFFAALNTACKVGVVSLIALGRFLRADTYTLFRLFLPATSLRSQFPMSDLICPAIVPGGKHV